MTMHSSSVLFTFIAVGLLSWLRSLKHFFMLDQVRHAVRVSSFLLTLEVYQMSFRFKHISLAWNCVHARKT